MNCNLPEVHGPDPTRSTPATEGHSGSDPTTSPLAVADEDHRLDVIGGAPKPEDVIVSQTPPQMPSCCRRAARASDDYWQRHPNGARIVDRTPTRVTPNSQAEDPGLKATSSASATKNGKLWDKAFQSLTEENPNLVKDHKRVLI